MKSNVTSRAAFVRDFIITTIAHCNRNDQHVITFRVIFHFKTYKFSAIILPLSVDEQSVARNV